MKNYYDILQINRTANEHEIKKAYKKLLRKYPPEKEPEKFKEIRLAYDNLKNEKSRKNYDIHLTYGKAIEDLEKIARRNIEAKNYYEAEKNLKKILIIHPKNPVILELLAEVYYMKKNYYDAIDILEELNDEYPENISYYILLGECYEELGEYFQALYIYETGYNLEPSNVALIRSIVNLHINNDNIDEAIDFLNDEINRDNTLDFDDFFALTLLLECYILKGEKWRIEHTLNRIKSIVLTDKESKEYVAWKLAQLGAKLFEAKSYVYSYDVFKMANQINENDSTILEGLRTVKNYKDVEILAGDNTIDYLLKIPIFITFIPEILDEEIRRDGIKIMQQKLKNSTQSELENYYTQLDRFKYNYPSLYNKQFEFYELLYSALREIKYPTQNNTNRQVNRSEGCYIATAVYGDYEAPEVLVLRKFRDEFLKDHFLGRLFIKIYYRYSPEMAKKLKSTSIITKAIRKILDKFVNYLKRK